MIEYNHKQKYYYLSKHEHAQFSAKEVLTLIKLLLGSRVLCLEELDKMTKSLMT